MMDFYFSGIAGRQEFEMLAAAGVKNLLVDHADARHIPFPRRIEMLDSGAYRSFKLGVDLTVEDFLQTAKTLARRADSIVAPDCIGNPAKTFRRWQRIKAEIAHKRLIPVWEWASPRKYLEAYLSEAKIVGIGGIARIMRAGGKTKEETKLRDTVTNELFELCREFPQRFHVFGLNYLKAIETLAPWARSADSSNWLRGGRYGYVIFKHTKNNHLTQAPAKFIPEYKNLDRAGRCIASARNIESFLNETSLEQNKKAA